MFTEEKQFRWIHRRLRHLMMQENTDRRRRFVRSKHALGAIAAHRVRQRFGIGKIRQLERADKIIKFKIGFDSETAKQQGTVLRKC